MENHIIEQNKTEYISLYNRYINREGKEKLLAYIESTDFFTAPASVRNHMAEPGGLCLHSLNVAKVLVQIMLTPGTVWHSYAIAKGITIETCMIVGLLHDLCKVKFYSVGMKAQKIYDQDVVLEARANKENVKHDGRGDFVWKDVPCYEIMDEEPFGHGENSLIRILENGGLNLTIDEKLAIRWHMGFSNPKEIWSTMNDAMDISPFIIAVNFADLTATHLMEIPENKDIVLQGNMIIQQKKTQTQANGTNKAAVQQVPRGMTNQSPQTSQQKSAQNYQQPTPVQQNAQNFQNVKNAPNTQNMPAPNFAQGQHQQMSPVPFPTGPANMNRQNNDKSFEQIMSEMGNDPFNANDNPFANK